MNEKLPIPRRQWAAMLGSVCSPSFPADAIEALTEMLFMLASWPDDFFTLQTVHDIATAKRRQSCPALDEITAVFSKIRLERLPENVRMGYVPAIPAPEAPREAPEHRAAAVQRAQAVIAELKSKAEMKIADQARIDPKYLTPQQLVFVRDNDPLVRAARSWMAGK